MPRGNDRGSREANPKGAAEAPKPVAGPPGLAEWFEEAWHGWLKPVGGIVLLIGGYFAYEYKVMPEGPAGRILVAIVLGAAIFAGLEPVLARFESRQKKLLVGGLGLLWAVAGAGPVFRTVFPSAVLAEAHIAAQKGPSLTDVKLPDGETGPYDLEVSGELKGSGEAEANYTLDVKGDGDANGKIEGAIKRTYFRQRVSRRSAATASVRRDNAENLHRLPSNVRGNKLQIGAEIAGESLEDGLSVMVHRAGMNPIAFFALGFLVLIVGLVLDYRLAAPKMDKTYLAMWAGFTLAFSAYYPTEATPHNLVRPAIAALLFALPVGLVPAWALSAIVTSFKPRPKKLAGTRA